MNYMGIITTEYHVVDTCVVLYVAPNSIHRYHTWRYSWYHIWMQRMMRSTYESCGLQ